MDHADDRDVISSVLAGDTDAYAVLVERYQKPIFNLMLRMAGSYEDAVDLAQETASRKERSSSHGSTP